MPEIPRFPVFGKEIDACQPGSISILKRDVRDIASKSDLEILGEGGFSTVFPLREDRVFAFDRGHYFCSVHRAKLEYYYQKILTTLYPNNFPRVSCIFDSLRDKAGNVTFGGSIRARVFTDYTRQEPFDDDTRGYEFHTQTVLGKKQKVVINGRAIRTFVPKEMLYKMLEWRENGIPLNLDTGKREHFRMDAEGNWKYLDLPFVTKGEKIKWDQEKIRLFMQRAGYTEQEIKIVQKSASRIIYLQERFTAISNLALKLSHLSWKDIDIATHDPAKLSMMLEASKIPHVELSEGDRAYLNKQAKANKAIYLS